jgi:hypothetical protein
MSNPVDGSSPQGVARATGLLYVLIMIGGYYAEGIVRSSVVVSRDAAATAHNIVSSEFFYLSGVATQLAVLLCDAAVAALLFILLRPVSFTASLLAAASRLIFVAILASSAIFYFAPVYLLDPAYQPVSNNVAEVQLLAMTALRLYTRGFQISLVFFGLNILLLGVLILRSTFLPRLLGLVLSAAGAGYMLFSFANFLVPQIANKDGIYLLLLGFVAELLLTLRLTLLGVNVEKWRATVQHHR